jgi:ribosomal protein L18E
MAGNANSGRRAEKPFADALRMEIAAAGPDHKRLRTIARALLDKAESGDMQAINALADRLDGKPAQESNVTVTRVNAVELSDDELAAIATGSGEGDNPSPVDPQQLN